MTRLNVPVITLYIGLCSIQYRYDHYRGVVCVVAVKDGSVGLGEYTYLQDLVSICVACV